MELLLVQICLMCACTSIWRFQADCPPLPMADQEFLEVVEEMIAVEERVRLEEEDEFNRQFFNESVRYRSTTLQYNIC